jgi:hypothetical protein
MIAFRFSSSELESSACEVRSSSSEVELSTKLLEVSSSELETSPDWVEVSVIELEVSADEVELSGSEVESRKVGFRFRSYGIAPCRGEFIRPWWVEPPCWAAFLCLALRWPGLAPAGDLLSCVAKKEGKEGDPCLTGRPRCGRLPCAARNRRPARNSSASPPQTAAPDIPACCCADQRFRTGFGEEPSLFEEACGVSSVRNCLIHHRVFPDAAWRHRHS